jgi:hypothetical protein
MAQEQNRPTEPTWRRGHTLALALILVLLILSCRVIVAEHRFLAWALNLALITGFVTIASHGITGLWRGVLIDEQNKMSLSRFQLAFWTVLLLGSYLTAALYNVRSGCENPLTIAMPEELWALMGISSTSLVASPFIAYTKSTKEVDPTKAQAQLQAQEQQIASRLGPAVRSDQPLVETRGQLVANVRPEYSQWSDMFKSCVVGAGDILDLAKVQMFFFTLVVGVAYAINLGAVFGTKAAFINQFPALHAGMVGLLGISHATYLTKKAIPISQS